MRIIKSLLIFYAFLGCLQQSYAQSDNSYSTEVLQKIQEIENGLKSAYGSETQSISDRMSAYNVQGLSIAVIDNYEIVWAKAYGHSESQHKTGTTTETVFQAGSMSKTINAMALLKMAETQDIDLDADVNGLLKSWQVPNKTNSPDRIVTLRQLLSHTAGLSVHGFGGYKKPGNLPNLVQILNGEKPANSRPVFPTILPNQEFLYSGGGTTLTQLVLTENGNMPYEQYIHEQIIEPLALKHSFYSVESERYEGQEIAYAHNGKGKTLNNRYNYYPESAAAGLWITPTDLATILIDLQHSLNGKEAKVLTNSAAKEMITPALPDGISALGIFAVNKGDEIYLEHSGATRGFSGKFTISTTTGQGVVVMVNGEKIKFVEEIIESVAQAYEWTGFEPLTVADISFSQEDIAAYTGAYQFKKRKVNIDYRKEAFFISEKGKWSGELMPLSRSSFVVKGIQPETTIEFKVDTSGKVSEIQATQGETVIWSKIDQ